MGDQPLAKRAPAPPAGPRGKTSGCRVPGCCSGSLPSASRELGAPRHPRAGGQGAPRRFAAVVACVPRCPTPRPGSASFASSGRAGVLGLRQGGRSLSHGGARPLLQALSLGTPPSRSVGPRHSRLSPSRLRAPSSRPESLRPRPPPAAGSWGASPVRPSNGEARTPGAPGRLPREGARPPPRLHPLRGAAAIWGPCQSRPLWGPRRARTGRRQPQRGPGPPTRRSPASASAGSQALRCPEGAVAAS